jgi:hypothetical protein
METNIDYRNNFMHVNTWKVRGNLIIAFQLRNMIGEVQGQMYENTHVIERIIVEV